MGEKPHGKVGHVRRQRAAPREGGRAQKRGGELQKTCTGSPRRWRKRGFRYTWKARTADLMIRGRVEPEVGGKKSKLGMHSATRAVDAGCGLNSERAREIGCYTSMESGDVSAHDRLVSGQRCGATEGRRRAERKAEKESDDGRIMIVHFRAISSL